MVLAALDAGLLVKQPREFSASAHNVYAPDVAVAIRSATVILADGTPHPETKKADADVMYEVGLAQALAKPTVFVSTPRSTALPLPIFVCGGKTCSHVEYDRSEVNFAGPLRQKVADRLREILGGMRPPHLIFDNDMGLRVAYSEVHHHRAEFWQPFEQIMNFGLTIKRMFGEILKHVYKMQQIVDLAHADAMALSATSEASLRQFRDVYEQYCKPYAKEIEISGSWIVAKTDAEEGFKDLLAILDKTEDVNRSIQSIVRQSFQFFQILECYLDEYLRAHDALLARTGNRSPNTLHHVIHLHAGVQSLAVSVHGFLRNWSSLAGVCIV
jgi:hypothetical protein